MLFQAISGRFDSGTAIATTLDKVVSKKSGDRLLELVVKDVSDELVLYKVKQAEYAGIIDKSVSACDSYPTWENSMYS